MNEIKVVKRTQLPARFPLHISLTAWLMLDRTQAPGWAWGVAGSLLALIWASWAVCIWKEKQIDIFKPYGEITK